MNKVYLSRSITYEVVQDIEYVLDRLGDGYDVYGFDEYMIGSSSIVYKYGEVIVKIGVDVMKFMKSGLLGENLLRISDGQMLNDLGEIIRVPDVYVYNDSIVVMEYVHGRSLSTLEGDVYDVAYGQLVDLYVRALDRGYMLRDLNDSNVLLTDDGVCILDLGDVRVLSDLERESYMKIVGLNRYDFFELNRYS